MMESQLLLDLVPAVALGIALAACAGLRAWLPLLLAGGLARAGLVQLGTAFQFLSSDRALVLFGVATLIELLADKVPALDHALDAVSTLLRPAVGSLLAASVLWPISDPLVAIALGVAVGAPSSLVPHAAKSAARVASSAFTAGLANPVLSLIEDVAVIALIALAVLLPVLAAALILGIAFLALRLLRGRRRPAVEARA
jgi:hypothetical protein